MFEKVTSIFKLLRHLNKYGEEGTLIRCIFLFIFFIFLPKCIYNVCIKLWMIYILNINIKFMFGMGLDKANNENNDL